MRTVCAALCLALLLATGCSGPGAMIRVEAPAWDPEKRERGSWVDSTIAIVPETYEGLVTSPLFQWLVGYLGHRFADLKDCGRASIGAGLGLPDASAEVDSDGVSIGSWVGLSAEVRAGDLTTVALGSQTASERFGIENRSLIGVWQSVEQPFPAAFLDPPEGVAGIMARSSVSYKRKEAQSRQISKNIISTYRSEPVGHWHPFYTRTDEEKAAFFNRALDIEASVVATVVSARAGVNVLEILDFALGLLTIDIARDDE